MLMTYLMSYVLCLIHLMYFSLMLGRVMLTCDSFALVGWASTPKGGFRSSQWRYCTKKHVSGVVLATRERNRKSQPAHRDIFLVDPHAEFEALGPRLRLSKTIL